MLHGLAFGTAVFSGIAPAEAGDKCATDMLRVRDDPGTGIDVMLQGLEGRTAKLSGINPGAAETSEMPKGAKGDIG